MTRFAALASLLLLAACDTAETFPEAEREYTKTISREADSDAEADLIAEAEAVYPSRDSVLAAAWNPEAIPKTGYWYYAGFDGVRIPYAITGDAVAYYSDLIDALEAGERFQFLTKATLEYRVAVDFHEAYTFEASDPTTGQPLPTETFVRVHVVEMELHWYQYCGDLCAMWVDHSRIVVFDEAGALLRVFLDGPRPIPVS